MDDKGTGVWSLIAFLSEPGKQLLSPATMLVSSIPTAMSNKVPLSLSNLDVIFARPKQTTKQLKRPKTTEVADGKQNQNSAK